MTTGNGRTQGLECDVEVVRDQMRLALAAQFARLGLHLRLRHLRQHGGQRVESEGELRIAECVECVCKEGAEWRCGASVC